jgi:hypothetical protein
MQERLIVPSASEPELFADDSAARQAGFSSGRFQPNCQILRQTHGNCVTRQIAD